MEHRLHAVLCGNFPHHTCSVPHCRGIRKTDFVDVNICASFPRQYWEECPQNIGNEIMSVKVTVVGKFLTKVTLPQMQFTLVAPHLFFLHFFFKW